MTGYPKKGAAVYAEYNTETGVLKYGKAKRDVENKDTPKSVTELQLRDNFDIIDVVQPVQATKGKAKIRTGPLYGLMEFKKKAGAKSKISAFKLEAVEQSTFEYFHDELCVTDVP